MLICLENKSTQLPKGTRIKKTFMSHIKQTSPDWLYHLSQHWTNSGHVVRDEVLFKIMMERRMRGTRITGRQRMGKVDNHMERTYTEMKRRVED